MRNMMNMAIAAVVMASPAAVNAAEWEYVVAPYVWMANAQGDSTVKGVPADVDIDFWDDIIENFDAGLQLHFEAKNADHPVQYITDLTWLSISGSGYQGPAKVTVGMDAVILDMKVAADIGDVQGLQWTAGVRYMQNDLSLKLTPPGFKVTDEQSWIDPVVGMRYIGHINEQWNYAVSADIGGFEILDGSDMTWSAAALLGWRFAENAEAAVGYRIIDTDYSDGSGFGKYSYEARQQGPIVGVLFRF
ncbi:MAG: hypothetical protein EP312_04375 [Gammaproteobacteria bacterium]|nr:MAG: hypothetical protein EP312_04375 [Gammaproteobacteria bacterium]